MNNLSKTLAVLALSLTGTAIAHAGCKDKYEVRIEPRGTTTPGHVDWYLYITNKTAQQGSVEFNWGTFPSSMQVVSTLRPQKSSLVMWANWTYSAKFAQGDSDSLKVNIQKVYDDRNGYGPFFAIYNCK